MIFISISCCTLPLPLSYLGSQSHQWLTRFLGHHCSPTSPMSFCPLCPSSCPISQPLSLLCSLALGSPFFCVHLSGSLIHSWTVLLLHWSSRFLGRHTRYLISATCFPPQLDPHSWVYWIRISVGGLQENLFAQSSPGNSDASEAVLRKWLFQKLSKMPCMPPFFCSQVSGKDASEGISVTKPPWCRPEMESDYG